MFHFSANAFRTERDHRRPVLALAVLVTLPRIAVYQLLGDADDAHRFPQRGKSVRPGALSSNARTEEEVGRELMP
jgi:hypothetical protein